MAKFRLTSEQRKVILRWYRVQFWTSVLAEMKHRITWPSEYRNSVALSSAVKRRMLTTGR